MQNVLLCNMYIQYGIMSNNIITCSGTKIAFCIQIDLSWPNEPTNLNFAHFQQPVSIFFLWNSHSSNNIFTNTATMQIAGHHRE